MNTKTHQSDPLVTTGGALTGGVVGAVIGSALGPLGAAIGAAAGTITGGAAGEHIGETMDERSDLVYFSEIFSDQPYYVSEMEWPDYEAAYRYACDTHETHSKLPSDVAQTELNSGWLHYNQHSHLTWPQAWQAICHAWEVLDAKNSNRA